MAFTGEITSNHPEMVRTGVDKYIERYGKSRQRRWTQLGYTRETTKMTFKKKFWEGAYGLLGVVNEATEVPTVGFRTFNETDFYWAKRGIADERSYESYDTDIYGLTKKIGRKMLISSDKTKESLSANQFNNMTSTGAAYVGMDDVAMVSTSHGYDGGTWSNRGVDVGGSSNVDADLSATNLELAVQKLMDTVDDNGDPDPVDGPFILYVPTALAGLGNRLTREMSPKLPGSANNDGNWAGGMIAKVLENPWLTDDDAWFLVAANADDNGLFMLEHGARMVETEKDKKSQTIAQILTEKYAFFCEDPRGIWGSPGA